MRMIAEDSKARRSKKPQAPSDKAENIGVFDNMEIGKHLDL
jgi:hypothetical protein